MQHTVIALFDTYPEAEAARDALIRAGFDRDGIALQARCEPTYASDATSAADTAPPADEGVIANIGRFFEALFVSEPRRHEIAQYAEAVRRGAVLLSADAPTDAYAELARSMLERSGAIDIEERAATWHAPDETTAAAWRAPDDETARAHSPLEELGIRRSAQRQRSPVRSYMRGAPAERGMEGAAERPATEAAATATACGSAAGMGAVFSAGRSDPADSGTAAEGATNAPAGAAAPIPDEFLQYEEDFRGDYETKYASDGSRYEDYERAYRHGAALGRDSRYAEPRAWEDVEPHAQRDWESAHPHNAWTRFKAAVRHGWERATHHDHHA
ncbi:hypothetical protein FAZ69_14590 [Trinickia terrae]|uniref:Uncharacterized protein n=1 Tax=Trinickia terrae TaxID=2571161 RepID=A0A4U1I4Y8_9BURK|nr:hypothetical protein [Trinickia terrae]TKC88369.1 hypothetical protein FAZ69_14590 [Trinickia terrae]